MKQSRNHQNRWHGWSFTPRQYGKFQQISPNLWQMSSPNGFLWKSGIAKNHHAIFWIVVDHHVPRKEIAHSIFHKKEPISHFMGKAIMFAISHSYPMDRCMRWTKSHSSPCLGSRPLRFRWDDPWPCRVTLICIYPPIQEDSSLYGGVQFMRVPPNHPSQTMTYIDLLPWWLGDQVTMT